MISPAGTKVSSPWRGAPGKGRQKNLPAPQGATELQRPRSYSTLDGVGQRFPTGDSSRTYEVFSGNMSEPLAQARGFLLHYEDRHACPLRRAALSGASTQAYIDYMSTDLATSRGCPRYVCVDPTNRYSLT